MTEIGLNLLLAVSWSLLHVETMPTSENSTYDLLFKQHPCDTHYSFQKGFMKWVSLFLFYR